MIKENTRNYGIDILRLLAMFQVVVLHTLSRGVLPGASALTAHYEAGFFIEALVYTCVNCFAIISGYIGVTKDFKYRRIINLWLQVVFYGLIIVLLFKSIPALANMLNDKSLLTNKPFLKAFTPITSGAYWYFTAYFFMFLLAPFINKAMKNINSREALVFIGTVIFLFIAYPYFTKKSFAELNLGYCALWITIMYSVGAALRSVKLPVKNKYIYLIGYFVMAAAAWAMKYITEYSSMKKGGFAEDKVFLQYTSVFIFLASVSLTLFFANVSVRNEKAQKIIKAAAPSAFAVYLIHVNNIVFSLNLWDKLRILCEKPIIVMILGVFANAAGIFVICIAVDFLRRLLFKLWNINRVINKASDFLVNKISKEDKNA